MKKKEYILSTRDRLYKKGKTGLKNYCLFFTCYSIYTEIRSIWEHLPGAQ